MVLQVPQFILEDAWYRGKGCRVVCTQPRRISAISGARWSALCCCAVPPELRRR